MLPSIPSIFFLLTLQVVQNRNFTSSFDVELSVSCELDDQSQPSPLADCLGCISDVCEGNVGNRLRDCPDVDKTCGTYGGKRQGNRLVNGVDIKCDEGKLIYAPFNGTLSFYAPFGDDSCVDFGVRIEGEGQWQGYYATIAYVHAFRTGGHVTKGEKIGKALQLHCHFQGSFQHHIQFQLHRQGKLIDPTYHLKDCMCTGQICQTNNKNEFTERGIFQPHIDFGKSFELRCPDVRPDVGQSFDSDQEKRPLIYSPIKGERLGRIRIREPRDDVDNCPNDGVFIIGSGAWKDYVVRIYNAQFLKAPGVGTFNIEQGQPIARRLKCPNTIHDSVFLEFRFKGRHVNVTELISASKCKQPQW